MCQGPKELIVENKKKVPLKLLKGTFTDMCSRRDSKRLLKSVSYIEC
ncbi:hypothetical protein SAMN04488084_106137 [Pedobacter antarcticus]|nr:hypothetical protein SAMN04488084_106137 [Pedobacter antarcticus]